MDAGSRAFDHNQVEQICRILGNELTGTEIGQLLTRLGLDNSAPQASKWARLAGAVTLQESEAESDVNSGALVRLIEAIMAPVRFAQRQQQFEQSSGALNSILAFSGLTLGRDGKIGPCEAITTLPLAPAQTAASQSQLASDIHDSLDKFRRDHPEPSKAAFIMMRFKTTEEHVAIANAIKEALKPHGIAGLRADDKWYHPTLFSNVKTYMHGCGFGVAVFERIETEQFNPNVALEVGYMMALGKPVCLLKDATLTALQADLGGMLYRQFKPSQAKLTIEPEITKWLSDYDLGSAI